MLLRGRLKRLVITLFLASSLILSRDVRVAYALSWEDIPWGEPCISGDPPALTDLVCVLIRVVGALFSVVGAVALISLILGAIRFVTAGGDEKALAQAKKAITYAVLGMIIAWGAVFIVDFIGKQLGYLGDLTKITIP